LLGRDLESGTPHVRADAAAEVSTKLTRELHAMNAGDARELADTRPFSGVVDRLMNALEPERRRATYRGGRFGCRDNIEDNLLDVFARAFSARCVHQSQKRTNGRTAAEPVPPVE